MDPYYILMKLPGSQQLEYLMMTPSRAEEETHDRPGWPRVATFRLREMLFYELRRQAGLWRTKSVQ